MQLVEGGFSTYDATIGDVVEGPHLVTVVVLLGSMGVVVPQYTMHMGPLGSTARAQEPQEV